MCPRSLISDEAWGLIGLWADWKSLGTTPWGEINRLPAYIYNVFRLCEAALGEVQSRMMDAAANQREEAGKNGQH